MSRDSYATRQARKAQRIADQALAEHPPGKPPVREMSDEDLRAAIAKGQEHERTGTLKPKWRLRLDALLAEQERRQIEEGKKILTMSDDYDWSDT